MAEDRSPEFSSSPSSGSSSTSSSSSSGSDHPPPARSPAKKDRPAAKAPDASRGRHGHSHSRSPKRETGGRPRSRSADRRRHPSSSPPRQRRREAERPVSRHSPHRRSRSPPNRRPSPPPRHHRRSASPARHRSERNGHERDRGALPPPPPAAPKGRPDRERDRDGDRREPGVGKPRERVNRFSSAAAEAPEDTPMPDVPLPGPPPLGGPGAPPEGEGEPPAPAVEPNFGLSGKLAEESNTVNGVVLLHNEPPEARRPTLRWRLYTFKNGEPFGEPLYIHRQTCYLFGRERRVVDVPTDHPSCSKQHGVLQFRFTEKEGEDGLMASAVRPYLMDLGSTNGTFLNGDRLEPQRYYELYEKDMIRFGNSSREYILLHEKSG
ncbi:hypothetical protein WJX72_011070 [[Myrmecia] bisecta]|uniref:FHA domain-containing protein n=1 Tax=[Myrmecia] bisecta TaxID=41462 RepID=A0AAW1P976_9CHLO